MNILHYAMFDAVIACKFRQNRFNSAGSWILYWSTLEMWQTLTNGKLSSLGCLEDRLFFS